MGSKKLHQQRVVPSWSVIVWHQQRRNATQEEIGVRGSVCFDSQPLENTHSGRNLAKREMVQPLLEHLSPFCRQPRTSESGDHELISTTVLFT